MPAKRKLTMRQLRQMLRLARDGASSREIARVLGIARSTVQENLKRAADEGLSWPLPGDLTDDALEARLFARAGVKPGVRRRPEPDWAKEQEALAELAIGGPELGQMLHVHMVSNS
jgi:transposase